MKKASGIILAPLSALYWAVMRARRALYARGSLRTHELGAPVISVGNITAGGTGKTPLVEWVARALAQEGRRPCVLTRGYGREDENRRVVVSDGVRVLAGAREGGDEPRLLAETLQGVAAVISDADRVAASRWALDNLGSDVFILDDGFQHLRVARDLNLVTLDATNPWGGGKLLPRGRLREPPRGLSRADCIVITRSEQAEDLDSLRKQAERLSGGRPVIISRTRTRALRPLHKMTEESAAPGHSTHHSLAAFCALGNPAAFFEHARRDGHTLTLTRAFPDHHVYTQGDVYKLVSEAARSGASALLTTAKDAVKLASLRFDLPCHVLEIEMSFDEEDKLRGMIREAIKA